MPVTERKEPFSEMEACLSMTMEKISFYEIYNDIQTVDGNAFQTYFRLSGNRALQDAAALYPMFLGRGVLHL